jgi:NADPH-dependent curcumin reductase CurA
VLVQFAKAQGLKVIASCGSDQKVSLVKSLGADHVFNYKTADTAAELKAHGPVDIYFDLVGGPTLEAAIENAAHKARFVICGMISQYNTDMKEAYGVRVSDISSGGSSTLTADVEPVVIK